MHWLGFLLLLLLTENALAAEIKAVRSWLENQATRVVFDLTDVAEYRVFTMRSPDRVVIDFSATRPRQTLSLPAAQTVKGLRYASRGEDGLRVVLDLAHAVSVESKRLAPGRDYGHRLMLDLNPASPPSKTAPAKLADSERLVAAPPAKPVEQKPTRAVPATSAERSEPVAKPVPAKQVVPHRSREVIIAIDAGHGGQDVGAIGPSGAYEKDITLAIARELAAVVNAHPGMKAILTRDGDRYLKLRERMERARLQRADLFISVHADAFRDRRVKGSSVYVLSQRGASSEAAKWLADHENAADLVGGVSLNDKDDVLKSVLIDLSQTASIDASIDVGKHVLAGLKRLGPVHKKRVQHAGFMVLKSPDIPSILVETAFISNPNEEKRLKNRNFRKKLAQAIFSGVEDYFERSPPPGTRMAEVRQHKVLRGDTLSRIANRYAVSVNSIKLANNMRSEMLRAGDVLKIP